MDPINRITKEQVVTGDIMTAQSSTKKRPDREDSNNTSEHSTTTTTTSGGDAAADVRENAEMLETEGEGGGDQQQQQQQQADDSAQPQNKKQRNHKPNQRQEKSNQRKNKQHGHQVLQRKVYEGCKILNPQGELMCRVSRRKIEWYLAKNLAKRIDESTIQLLFQPKGEGNIGDSFYLSEKENKCVGCGSEKELTQHHTIPYEYRKHFPEKLKSAHSHDVVLLCVDCHESYETTAIKLKKELAAKYGIPLEGKGKYLDTTIGALKRAANALLRYRDKMPKQRIRELQETIAKIRNLPFDQDTNLDELITDELLKQISSLDPLVVTGEYISAGEHIMKQIAGEAIDNVEKIEEFSTMWRQHFIEVLKPKHLNPYWDPARPLLRPGETFTSRQVPINNNSNNNKL